MPDIFSLFIVCFVICFVFLAFLLKSIINGKIEEAKMVKNYRELFSQTKQSAENGDIKSMYLLSSLYLKGIGVEQDIEKAFYLYKTAVEK